MVKSCVKECACVFYTSPKLDEESLEETLCSHVKYFQNMNNRVFPLKLSMCNKLVIISKHIGTAQEIHSCDALPDS